MDLSSGKTPKELLSAHGVTPSKGFGQNFLIDEAIFQKILETAQLGPEDVVLEVGPGTGGLTLRLAKKAKKVIAIEKDERMVEILKTTLAGINNIEVIQGDALRVQLKLPENYKIVANLPYYIVSPLIRKFLELDGPRPKKMVLMVQKEVARRICSEPPDMSLLAVSVQFYATPKIISLVSRKSFWPMPEVDSAILEIIPRGKKDEQIIPLFFRIVKIGFSQPRKQLINNLSNGLGLDRGETETWLVKNKIKPVQRAETLSVNDWIRLSKSFPQ